MCNDMVNVLIKLREKSAAGGWGMIFFKKKINTTVILLRTVMVVGLYWSLIVLKIENCQVLQFEEKWQQSQIFKATFDCWTLCFESVIFFCCPVWGGVGVLIVKYYLDLLRWYVQHLYWDTNTLAQAQKLHFMVDIADTNEITLMSDPAVIINKFNTFREVNLGDREASTRQEEWKKRLEISGRNCQLLWIEVGFPVPSWSEISLTFTNSCLLSPADILTWLLIKPELLSLMLWCPKEMTSPC